VKYYLAILAVVDGQSVAQVALVLRVHEKTVATWIPAFCCYGLPGAPRTKPPGRPPTLTPTQKADRATLLDEGPVQAGFSGACWRSPMIQQPICGYLLKAGHFVSSITYREGLMALPRQGQLIDLR